MANKKLSNNIKLFVYDFDGVMTNNKVYVDQNGKESVQVNRADGLAISQFKKLNYSQIIISTETNKVVLKRAEKLKISAFVGIDDKSNILKKYCSDKKIKLNEVCYVGNDTNDLEAMKIAGFSFCPNDSDPQIKKICKIILKKNGGDGVIKEIYNYIIG